MIFNHDICVARPIIMQIFPCYDQWSGELVQQTQSVCTMISTYVAETSDAGSTWYLQRSEFSCHLSVKRVPVNLKKLVRRYIR